MFFRPPIPLLNRDPNSLFYIVCFRQLKELKLFLNKKYFIKIITKKIKKISQLTEPNFNLDANSIGY